MSNLSGLQAVLEGAEIKEEEFAAELTLLEVIVPLPICYHDVVPFSQQPLGQVTANESPTSSNKNLHVLNIKG